MTHKYLPLLLLLLFLTCGVTVIVSTNLFVTPYINTYESHARTETFAIANAIRAYHFVKGVYPVPEYVCQSNYTLLCLQELVKSNFLKATDSLNEESQWVDRLNVPYNLQIRGASITTNDFNKTFNETMNDVIVWASGRNGINEYGKGDDIVGSYPPKKNQKSEKENQRTIRVNPNTR